jgi:hypothetical protein
MENLARLVNESLARHGVDPVLDHRRLQWSEWFCCKSHSIFVPGKAGIFALAEEVTAPGEISASDGKRMLAVFQISETDDLGWVLGPVFIDSPGRDRLASGGCFARYVVIEDPAQRRSALAALEQGILRRSYAEH